MASHRSTMPGDSGRRRGFTLLEMVVSLVVLVIVMSALGMVLRSSQRLFVYASQRGELVERGRRLFDQLERELLVARLVSLETDAGQPPRIVYQVPVDLGEDLNGNGVLDPGEDANHNGVLDAQPSPFSGSGLVLWGAREGNAVWAGRTITLAFEPMGIVTEVELNVDVNGDGDLRDSFARGRLVRTVEGQAPRPLGNDEVLVPHPVAGGDRDADGLDDPMFSVIGEPFVDSNHNGVFDSTENYTDRNGNGRWDGGWALDVSFVLLDTDRGVHVLTLHRQLAARNPQVP